MIFVNCSNISKGGGIQVARSIISHMYSHGIDFHAVVSPELLVQLSDDIQQKTSTYRILPNLRNIITGRDRYLDIKLKQSKANVVLSIFGPTYWNPRVSRHVVGYAKPHYIYRDSPFFDLISRRHRLKLNILRKIHLRDFKRNADIIYTETDDVTSKLRIILQKKSYGLVRVVTLV